MITVFRQLLLAGVFTALSLFAFSARSASLLELLEATPDGGWVKANTNSFSDAYPPVSLGYANPQTVIGAWSSFSWDSKRDKLMLFGGGHGNYAGNEVYLWDGATGAWGRGSLPSKVAGIFTPNGWVAMPVDGHLYAPPSMHTYDNTAYLAAADRFLVLNGPAYNASSGPVKANGAATGPYVWNPALADPNKVGGTTGSGLNPATQGGQMWQNRDRTDLFKVTTWAGTFGIGHTDGTSAAVVEAGRDVLYFTGRAGPNAYLMRYEIDPVNSALDSMRVVGATNSGSGPYGAGAMDTQHGRYLALAETGNSFVVWDTNSALGQANGSITIGYTGPTFDGALISGLDYDPVRDSFMAWSGAGDVWELKAPSSGVLTDSWTLSLATDGDTFAADAKPDGMNVSGVRGKWKYVDTLGAFVALEGNPSGDVWLYRPNGWVSPVPEPSTYALMLAGVLMLARRLRSTV